MSVPLTLPVPTAGAGTNSPVPFPAVLELGEHRLRLLDRARIYACGITPYDVTHLGHAATFLWVDTLARVRLARTTSDLYVASRAVTPWWNAAAQSQATDRAYRIGQKRPVFVYNLIVAGSVEERMLRLQQKKQQLAATLLGSAGVPSRLTENDLDDLFAPLAD